MTQMACSSSMSHLETRLRKDTTLVFNWILVLSLLVASNAEASPPPPKLVNSTVGGTSEFRPCSTDKSQDIKSIIWGNGSSPTDESLLFLERNYDDNDVYSGQRISVDENFCLIIKNTTMEDAGPYWCQVTPRKKLSYSCSFTLIVSEKEPVPIETTLTTARSIMLERNVAASISKAAPTVFSLSVSMCMSLASGLLSLWLMNVAGVG